MTGATVTLRLTVVRDALLWAAVAAAAAWTFAYRAATSRAQVLDYDDGVYWQTALAIADGARPYTEVFHAQPPLFPWLVAQPFALLGAVDGETTARLLMTGFTMLLAASAAGMAAVLRGPRAGMLAALAVAAFPLVQRYSFQFGADLPAAALGGVALCLALRARSAGRSARWWWAGSGAALCLAALVKLIAVVVVPSLALALLATASAGVPGFWAWLRRTAVAIGCFLAGFAAAAATALLVIRPGRAAWDQVFSFHLKAAESVNSPDVVGMIRNTGDWGLPYFIAAGVGGLLALCLPGRSGGRADVAAIAVWAAAIVPYGYLHHPVFKHHVLLFIAPAGALIVLGVAALWAVARRVVQRITGPRRRWAGAVAVVAALVAGTWQTTHSTVAPVLADTSVEACLRALPRDVVLVSDDQAMLARAGLRTPPWLVDTSHVRIDSGWLTDAEITAAASAADGVLFARPRRIGKHPEVRVWAKAYFPVRYTADRYELYVHAAPLVTGCAGKVEIDGKTVTPKP
ncbi:ArnT family glycosyltransferase [Catellatospora sichuanensis]|uniref:ArnT family glycosyltransferase n=1 Tax=Catellatospora sichuanensis TaxID=1969805 RepID=UPI00118367E4|nr:glycosyltransferase family 39 protein [Catellatospora sichuanensis]